MNHDGTGLDVVRDRDDEIARRRSGGGRSFPEDNFLAIHQPGYFSDGTRIKALSNADFRHVHRILEIYREPFPRRRPVPAKSKP